MRCHLFRDFFQGEGLHEIAMQIRFFDEFIFCLVIQLNMKENVHYNQIGWDIICILHGYGFLHLYHRCYSSSCNPGEI